MDSHPGRILIVDDEPQICELVSEALSERGFDCRATPAPLQARQLLAGGGFAVVICDIRMPHLTGLDLLVHAKRHAPDCKVILMTGASDNDLLARAIVLGAYAYVEKPFDFLELAELVGRAMGGDADMHMPLMPAMHG